MRFDLHTCATVTAPPRLVDRGASWRPRSFPVRWGLVEHPRQGLILIDTGYSPEIFASRDPQLIVYRNLLRPRLTDAGDPLSVLGCMGARPEDVRLIILTHLHADHCCGLGRFPRAHILCSLDSLADWRERPRFSAPGKAFFPSLLPRLEEVSHAPCESCPAVHLPWGSKGHDLLGDGSLLSMALPGHMRGHIGLLLPELPQPLLYAADVEWTHEALSSEDPPTLLARWIMETPAEAKQSKAIIRSARRDGFKIALCHDAHDF